jgi:nucleotide-binding universal stress UspA family protein
MKILTALDRSEYAEIVLEHAVERAAREPGAELHFVTIVGEGQRDSAFAWLHTLVREALDAFRIPARAYTLHVLDGPTVPAIAQLVSELRADLLVIGRFHVPSTSDPLLAIVESATLVVGIDGVVLEPQCPKCREVRRQTEGEALFCARHAGDRADLVTRVPVATYSPGRGLW